MVSASAMVSAIFVIVIVGLIVWLLFWLIGYLALPEPFNKIAHVLLAVLAVFFLINVLLGLAGVTPLVRLGP